MSFGVSISKQDTEVNLNPQVVPAGKIWYATDTDKYAIGDGFNIFQNLQSYTLDELRKMSQADNAWINSIKSVVDLQDVLVDGGDLD